MKLEIWGTRGSSPAPSGKTPAGKQHITYEYGGNTTCYRIIAADGSQHIIDAGTGIRQLGLHMADEYFGNKVPMKANLFMSHTHWDHIQGFPFFVPGYIPDADITVFAQAKVKDDMNEAVAGHSEYGDAINFVNTKLIQIQGEGIQQVLDNQQNPRNFPVPLAIMKGIKNFYDFKVGGEIGISNNLSIYTEMLNHPGDSIGYKFVEKDNGVIAVTTDFEPDYGSKDEKLKAFAANADVWLADGQYETDSKDNPFMEGYGHSDPFINTRWAMDMGVQNLINIHLEPKADDAYNHDLERRLQEEATKMLKKRGRRPGSFNVYIAKEGDVYEVEQGAMRRVA